MQLQIKKKKKGKQLFAYVTHGPNKTHIAINFHQIYIPYSNLDTACTKTTLEINRRDIVGKQSYYYVTYILNLLYIAINFQHDFQRVTTFLFSV